MRIDIAITIDDEALKTLLHGFAAALNLPAIKPAPSTPPQSASLPAPLTEKPAMTAKPKAAPPARVSIKGTPIGRSTIWNFDRVAMLERDYPANVPLDVLFKSLNALPGDPISSKNAIGVKAVKLALCRTVQPEPTTAAPRQTEPRKSWLEPQLIGKIRKPAPAAAEKPRDEPTDDLPSFTQSWAAILSWGERHGVNTLEGSDEDVLARINLARREAALPIFVEASEAT